MTFYGELASTALDLISEFGQSMTLRHYPDVPADGYSEQYNPADRSVSKGAPVDYTVQGVAEQATAGKIASFGDKLRDLALERIRFVTVAASGLAIVPQPQDQLYFDGGWWTIKGSSDVNPAGTPLIYGLGVVR